MKCYARNKFDHATWGIRHSCISVHNKSLLNRTNPFLSLQTTFSFVFVTFSRLLSISAVSHLKKFPQCVKRYLKNTKWCTEAWNRRLIHAKKSDNSYYTFSHLENFRFSCTFQVFGLMCVSRSQRHSQWRSNKGKETRTVASWDTTDPCFKHWHWNLSNQNNIKLQNFVLL